MASLALAAAGGPRAASHAPHPAHPSGADEPLEPTNRPVEELTDGYVSSDRCRACHPDQYASWHASFHRTMTQVATPETVVAPVDDVSLEIFGRTVRLWRDGDVIRTELPDPEWPGPFEEAPLVTREIVMTTGSHLTQAYWTPSGMGRRLSLFPFCYRIPEQRWIPIHSAFVFPPEERQTTGAGRWNNVCNKCHATNSRPRLGDEREGTDTRVAEFGIACEACHGPAEEHVRANQNPLRRYGLHLGDGVDDTIVHAGRLDPVRGSQTCAQCHGITVPKNERRRLAWRGEGYSYRPGQDIEKSRKILTEGEQYFWDDGMIRVSGREYNGLQRSPCFTHGDEEAGVMTCFSCHEMHPETDDERSLEEWRVDMLAPGMDGDRACTQCHDEYADPEAVAEHTHHPVGSAGASCMGCHMPFTTWGLLKGIRTHEIASPSVRESVLFGRPNACNLCHLDRTLAWTAEHLRDWYDEGSPRIPAAHDGVAAAVVWTLSGDAGQRALLAYAMGRDEARAATGRTTWFLPLLAQLLEDPYDAVRFRAQATLDELLATDPALAGLERPADFLDEADARRDAKRALWNAFGQLDLGELAGREELLLGRHGVRWQQLQRLVEVRDHRRVGLNE